MARHVTRFSRNFDATLSRRLEGAGKHEPPTTAKGLARQIAADEVAALSADKRPRPAEMEAAVNAQADRLANKMSSWRLGDATPDTQAELMQVLTFMDSQMPASMWVDLWKEARAERARQSRQRKGAEPPEDTPTRQAAIFNQVAGNQTIHGTQHNLAEGDLTIVYDGRAVLYRDIHPNN